MNPESELSKAVAKFITDDLAVMLIGCGALIIMTLVFGWALGSCAVMEEYSLRRMKVKHGVAPITSTIEKEIRK